MFIQAVTLLVLTQGSLTKTDLKVGTGDVCKSGDVVTVLYKGTLKSGKVFDQSGPDRPPFSFRLDAGQVIKGWDQGVEGMKVGGKRKLVIPPALAYGDQDLGDIPPKSTLVFEVELLRVDKKGATPKVETKSVKQGSGVGVKLGDSVTLHYTGTFINGVKFDSSRDRSEPITFNMKEGALIKGFLDSVIGMKKGERKVITIPYQLGYGENGRSPVIPRMATLKFDIEIINIKS